MLNLPKLNKGMKQAMTKIEKASKVIVGAALVVGLSIAALPTNQAQAAITNPAVAQSQGAMVLTPSFGGGDMIADHYSHSSHESHSSHYSHYSSRY
jgi:hypothetical protein